MKQETKEALLQSIEHWKENEKVKELSNAHIYMDHCALCRRFNRYSSLSCKLDHGEFIEKCPVYEKTGQPECRASPWRDCSDAKFCDVDLSKFKKAAKAERKFLESLLPKDETT